MTRRYIPAVTLTLLITVAPAFGTASGPLVLAQSTAAPARDNSPAIPLPPQPAPRPLTGPSPTAPPQAPKPPQTVKPATPHPDLTMPKQIRRVPAPRPTRPQKPESVPGGITPRPAGSSRLGSTSVRRNQAVVLCNQRQISCKSRCNSHTMGRTGSMCDKQCTALFQSCVNRANSQP